MGYSAIRALKEANKSQSRLIEKQEEQLTQSKARIEQLENRIGEMEAFTSAGYHADKYKEMKVRIRELEKRLVRIYEQIEHVYDSPKEQILAQLDNVKGDICVTLGKALSAKFTQSDKEK